MPKPNTDHDVFKSIDIPENGDPIPCWEWTGAKSNNGTRGMFTLRGVKWLAYRLVYTLVYGELAKGEVVRHKCDNPLCCNPHHLEVGSQSDNENDKYERDRYGFPRAVIDRIMDLNNNGYNGQQITQVAIAALVTEELGVEVTSNRVSDIVNGKRRVRQSKASNEDNENGSE